MRRQQNRRLAKDSPAATDRSAEYDRITDAYLFGLLNGRLQMGVPFYLSPCLMSNTPGAPAAAAPPSFEEHAGEHAALEKLLGLLTLERIEDNIFRGQSHDIGSGSVFGGQAVGQALRAASYTVEEDRPAHSLHGYFILPGDPRAPIVYDVERIRDGRSFATRRVVAVQHGRAIFNMAASFQAREEGFAHQMDAPEVPGPETLKSEEALRREAAERAGASRSSSRGKSRAAEHRRALTTQPWPIAFHPVTPADPLRPEPRPPRQQAWIRANGPLPDGDDALHRALLAYASDYALMGTSLLPHGLSFLQEDVMVASLDHALWIHQPFRMDEWLLYAMESTVASSARGLNRGAFFRQDGTLVASVTQEGLMRRRGPS